MNSNSFLSLLCWGFWKKTTQYGGKLYRVSAILNDPKPGALWVAEPSTTADFLYKNKQVIITGCFRHVSCKRLSVTGQAFLDFMCSMCSELVHATDFRLRVIREGRALVKRGFRDTQIGRRVDLLSSKELVVHSHQLARKYHEEKARYWLMRSRVAQLKMTHRGLKLSAVESFNRKDVISFCNNILAAHRTNAFGGKPALWDFLRDVATNLNQVSQGDRFSKNTKSFAQAMKIYGGRHMCDLFALNFEGPSYDTIRRENRKGVQFIAGEHTALFSCVTNIYRDAKSAHGVQGHVLVILAEDETKVKARISWEARSDALVGFCGPKEDHAFISTFRPQVGDGQSGYEAIVDAFKLQKKRQFCTSHHGESFACKTS